MELQWYRVWFDSPEGPYYRIHHTVSQQVVERIEGRNPSFIRAEPYEPTEQDHKQLARRLWPLIKWAMDVLEERRQEEKAAGF